MKDDQPIPIKSKWRRKGSGPQGLVARVMGEVEGYIVWRFKGAAPQLLHRNSWRAKFEEAIGHE